MNPDSIPSLPAKLVSHSPEETFEFAHSIGEQLKGSCVFLLQGDLGAGKTVFAKGIAAGLGIDPADVVSPTFTLVNEYQGRLKLYHLDLYRLEAGAELLYNLGLEEMLSQSDAVVIIEWAERLLDYSLPQSVEVVFTITGEFEREVTPHVRQTSVCR